jgi:hypothetical protein
VQLEEFDGPMGNHELDLDEARRELGGRDLVCWCPIDQPCHADVLLEIANQESVTSAPNAGGERQ